MIHYHGGPINPSEAAFATWEAKHAFVSFARPEKIALAAEVSQSFAVDNGAFTFFKRGHGDVDVPGYAEFVRRWSLHPSFDWCLTPDKIGGTEAENDALIETWESLNLRALSVPVWHLHESLERLQRLAKTYHRVALGSSGRFWKVKSAPWWQRMGEALDAICDAEGFPLCKLHGLRMLNPTVFSQLPLSSADSTNVAQNIGIDQAWRGPYAPTSREDRAVVMTGRIERHAAARRWTRTFGHQENLDLLG